MISENAGDCYVYITLPGTTEPVTAGRFTLTMTRQGVPQGRFIYGRTYLARADAVPLDPIELKLAPRTYETVAFLGVFGALRDASPDYWGRRVIQRHLALAQPGEMAHLLHSPDDRAGALGFGLNQAPPAPKRAFNQTLDLATLQQVADAIDADEEQPSDAVHQQVENLLLVGTSMGGARPCRSTCKRLQPSQPMPALPAGPRRRGGDDCGHGGGCPRTVASGCAHGRSLGTRLPCDCFRVCVSGVQARAGIGALNRLAGASVRGVSP